MVLAGRVGVTGSDKAWIASGLVVGLVDHANVVDRDIRERSQCPNRLYNGCYG